MFGNSAQYESDATPKANMERDEMELDEKNSLGTELYKLYNEIIKDVQKTETNIQLLM